MHIGLDDISHPLQERSAPGQDNPRLQDIRGKLSTDTDTLAVAVRVFNRHADGT